MTTPWLSVLIPVYNVEPYIAACLQSVLVQADSNVEILLLNDCSTDQSLEAISRLGAASTRYSIIQHTHNRGLSAARNTLLDHAQGDYIWLLDSDDFLMLGAIQALKSIITAQMPDLVICDFCLDRENFRLKHRLRGEGHRASFVGAGRALSVDKNALFAGLYTAGQLHAWSKIAKRALWQNLRFPEGRLMEDMVTTPRLLLAANTYYYCPEVWVAYRQRPGSILSTPNLQRLTDASLANRGVLQAWLEQHPTLSAPALFAYAHFCAKSYTGIVKKLRAAGKSAEINFHKQEFLNNTQCGVHWIIAEYLKRGWLLRAWRLWRCL